MKPGRKYQTKRAVLLLADGTRFEGDGIGPDATALGEAVFYTGMTGYEEALTDPSYAGQILTFTYPLIGNYGVSRSVSQHPQATVSGCVIKHLARRPSHFENAIDLGSWLEEQAIPTIVGVDTRAMTIALREHGTIAAALAVGDKAVAGVDATLTAYARTMTTAGLVESVSDAYHAGETIGNGSTHIVLLDCGVKRAIIRELEALDARVTVLPFGATRDEIDGHHPDAIVISPGPGRSARLTGDGRNAPRFGGRSPAVRRVLGPPTAGASVRCDDLQAPLRTSRRQPAGQGSHQRRGPHHRPQSRLCGRWGDAARPP